jgi:hypothetical protein
VSTLRDRAFADGINTEGDNTTIDIGPEDNGDDNDVRLLDRVLIRGLTIRIDLTVDGINVTTSSVREATGRVVTSWDFVAGSRDLTIALVLTEGTDAIGLANALIIGAFGHATTRVDDAKSIGLHWGLVLAPATAIRGRAPAGIIQERALVVARRRYRVIWNTSGEAGLVVFSAEVLAGVEASNLGKNAQREFRLALRDTDVLERDGDRGGDTSAGASGSVT